MFATDYTIDLTIWMDGQPNRLIQGYFQKKDTTDNRKRLCDGLRFLDQEFLFLDSELNCAIDVIAMPPWTDGPLYAACACKAHEYARDVREITGAPSSSYQLGIAAGFATQDDCLRPQQTEAPHG
jgi:hypothetical protein